MKLRTPAVSTLNAGRGNTVHGEFVFGMAVASVFEFYDAKITEAQGTDLKHLLHQHFYWLQFAEVKHFTIQAKAGQFNKKESRKRRNADGYFDGEDEWDGKIYGALTPALFFKWMERYAEESLAVRAMVYGESRTDLVTTEPLRPGDVGPERAAQAVSEWKQSLLSMSPKSTDEIEEENRRQARIKRVRAQFFATTRNPTGEERALSPESSADAAKLELEIWDFCDRIVDNQPVNSVADIKFYQNNRAAIETELKGRKNWLGDDVMKPGKPISKTHAEREEQSKQNGDDRRK